MKQNQIRVLELLRKAAWQTNEQLCQKFYLDTRRASNNYMARILAELINMGYAESRPIESKSYCEYRKLVSSNDINELNEKIEEYLEIQRGYPVSCTEYHKIEKNIQQLIAKSRKK